MLQLQNLGGSFVVFFLGGQNRNFGKVRRLKLLLSLNYNVQVEYLYAKTIPTD